MYLKKCFDKCQDERYQLWNDYKVWQADPSKKGEVYPFAYDLEVADLRKDAIDLIYAFMGSALDRHYPFLDGGFKNNLPSDLRKCYEVFWTEFLHHGYLSGLRLAARQLNISTHQLQAILNRIDDVASYLFKGAVKDIVKAKTDNEIMFARHRFEQTVAANKNMIMNLRLSIKA